MTALMTALRRRLADRPLVAAMAALLAAMALYLHASPAAVSTPPPGGPHELLRLPDGRIVASLEQAGALAVIEID